MLTKILKITVRFKHDTPNLTARNRFIVGNGLIVVYRHKLNSLLYPTFPIFQLQRWNGRVTTPNIIVAYRSKFFRGFK